MPCHHADWPSPWYNRPPWCYPYAVLVLAWWAVQVVWQRVKEVWRR